jgi:hypothetical protein
MSSRAPDYSDKTDEGPPPRHVASEPAPVLEPNEARGGTTHHNVRYVLLFGIVVLVVLYVIVYFGFFAGSAPPTVPPPAPGSG